MFESQKFLFPHTDSKLTNNTVPPTELLMFPKHLFTCILIDLFSTRGKENFLEAFVIPYFHTNLEQTGVSEEIHLQVNLVEHHWVPSFDRSSNWIKGKYSDLHFTVNILPFYNCVRVKDNNINKNSINSLLKDPLL